MINSHYLDFVRKQNQSLSTVDASSKEEDKLILETLYTPFECKGSVERDHRDSLMDAACGTAVSPLVDHFNKAC